MSIDFFDVVEAICANYESRAVYKLESLRATVTAGKPVLSVSSRTINEIFTNHGGAASYIIDRKAAEALVEAFSDFHLPVDTEISNFERRQVQGIRVFQCFPACAVQDTELLPPTFLSSIYERSDVPSFRNRLLNSRPFRLIKPAHRWLYSLFLPSGQKRMLVTYRL